MNGLSQGPIADGAPVLSIITEPGCGAEELARIAALLEAQTLKNWQWLYRSNEADEGLIAGSAAMLVLPRAPKALRATALEEAIWFLLARPSTPWVELRDGAQRADLFIERESVPEGCIGLRLNNSAGAGTTRLELSNPLPTRAGKRLLLLIPWLEPGGADRCNLDILRVLARDGWELTVVASLAAEHRWLDRFLALTADVWVLPDFLVAEQAFDFLAYLLASRKPDLVLLSNSAFAYDAVGFIQERCPGLPLIDLNHMEEAWDAGGHPGSAVKHSALLNRHWVVSGHLRQWLVDHGVEAGKVEVLHWFADIERWKPCPARRAEVRARLGIDPECVLIAYAGRLCQQKRPDLFAASLHELARSHAGFAALVMGDGELSGQLRNDLWRYGLTDRVRMLGWQDEEQLCELFQAADILFLPSAGEGIALVLYEAMACGLAVVATKVGGQAELVSAECGFLVARSSPEQEAMDYATALGALLDDPALLQRMGRSSALRVRDAFSPAHFEHRLRGLLGRVQTPARPLGRVHCPDLTTGVTRLSMQWSAYRLLVGLRRHWLLQGRWRLLQLMEPCVKGLSLVRAFGVGAIWRRFRKQ
ncbi:D-inositol 3-phosphate glycosyltransferase [compost metagenome]